MPGTDIFDTGASTGAKPSGAKYDRAYNAFYSMLNMYMIKIFCSGVFKK